MFSVLLLIAGVNLPVENYHQKEQKTLNLLIENCNIVDTKNGLTVLNQNVYIENGLFTAITSKPYTQRTDYKAISGKNKFVLSTLWDIYLHTLNLVLSGI